MKLLEDKPVAIHITTALTVIIFIIGFTWNIRDFAQDFEAKQYNLESRQILIEANLINATNDIQKNESKIETLQASETNIRVKIADIKSILLRLEESVNKKLQ